MDEKKIEALFEKHCKTFTGTGDHCFDYVTLDGFKAAVKEAIAIKEDGRSWSEKCAAEGRNCQCGSICKFKL